MDKIKRAGAFLIAGLCVGIGFFLPFAFYHITYHQKAFSSNGTVVSDILLSLRDYSTIDTNFPNMILTPFISLLAAVAALFFLTGCVLLNDKLAGFLHEARLRSLLVGFWVTQVVLFLSLTLAIFSPDTFQVTIEGGPVHVLGLSYTRGFTDRIDFTSGTPIYNLAVLSTPGWGVWVIALGIIIGGVSVFLLYKKGKGEAKAP